MEIPQLGSFNTNTTANAHESKETSRNDEMDRQAFLELLVTQLRHQDPMDPMKQEEYASQLAQFSSVEQLANLNERFDQMYKTNLQLNRSITNTMATTLVGKSIRAIGDGVAYSSSRNNILNFRLGSGAQDVTLTIRDSQGNVVQTKNLGGMAAGDHSWEWNGRFRESGRAENGEQFTFSVSAKSASGQTIDAFTFVDGQVTGIEYSNGGQMYFLLGELRVAAGDVHRIYDGG